MNRDHPDAWSRDNYKPQKILVPIKNADIRIRRVNRKDSREPFTTIKSSSEFRTPRRRKTDMDRSKSRMRGRRRFGDDDGSEDARTDHEIDYRGNREQPVYTTKLKLNQASGDLGRKRSNDDNDDTEARLIKLEIGDLMAELEMLRKENDSLTQRLKERERKDRMGDDEKNRLKDRIKELESWQARLQLQLDSQEKDDESRSRFLQTEINKLLSDLDRKSKLVDQLMADIERQKALSIPLERERDLQRQLDEMTTKAEINFRKFQDALHDLEVLKRTRVPKDREQDLLVQLEEALKALRSKERLVDELTRDKKELLMIKDDTEKRMNDLKSSVKDGERTNAMMTEKKEALEDTIADLKAEIDRLRLEKDEKENERLKAHLKFSALEERSKGVLDTIRPLQELVREQDAHIIDLQREVDTMRQALGEYQKQMGKLRVLISDEEATRDRFQDIATAHRKLLDENARLLAILERRQLMDARTLSDQSQMKIRLEQARNKLKSSQNRIAQLEDWLDEIYNDKHFDTVLKTSTVTGARALARRSLSPTLTLPLVPNYRSLSESRRQIAKRKLLGLDNKLGYLTDRL